MIIKKTPCILTLFQTDSNTILLTIVVIESNKKNYSLTK